MANFKVLDVNPNEDTGGGGCLGGGESKREDCQGPYVVFSHVSTDSNVSPHAVLCAKCLAEATKAVDNPEPEVIDAVAVEVDDDIPEV